MVGIFRIVIGGIGDIETDHIGGVAHVAGIDGFTVTQGTGFHVRWGAETVTILETCADSAAVDIFVSILLTVGAQECAYVTVNGSTAALWYPDGRKESIHPIDSDAAEFLDSVRTVRADTLTVANHLRGLPCDCGYCGKRSNALPPKPQAYKTRG